MLKSKVPITVFASGRGSNFRAIAEAAKAGRLPVDILSLVCDDPKAGVLQIAEEYAVPIQIVERKPGEDREDHDERVLFSLAREPLFLVLAGYRRILSPILIERFRAPNTDYTRIVNVHPSLLPAFPGLDSYRQAFQMGCKVTGVTVHLVEEEVDAGPILAQQAFPIGDCVNAAEVEARGLAIEHQLYPQTLSWLVQGKFRAEKREGRIHVRPG